MHVDDGQESLSNDPIEGALFPEMVIFEPRWGYELWSQLWQRSAALIGLILLSPLLILLAVWVKLSSPGPALYQGARVGLREEVFQIFKFRTMKVGSEQKIGQRLVQQDEDHYTSIGKRLRRYRLDELPQLINVLRGEMALVGPRPLRPIFLENHKASIPNYAKRFLIRPGITGLAQVRGGYYTHPRHKLLYDLLYLSRRSFLLDLRLICLTFLRVLTKVFTLTAISFWLFALILTLPKSYHAAFTIKLPVLSFNSLYLLPLIGCLLHLIARRERGRGATLLKTPMEGPFLVFAFSGAVAGLTSWTPLNAFRGLAWYVCNGFIFFYLHANLQRDESRGERVLSQLLMISTGMVAFSCSLSFWGWFSLGIWDRPGGSFDDPLHFAALLAMLTPLAFYFSETREQRWSKMIGAFFCLSLLASGSRLGLFACGFAAFLCLPLRGIYRLGLSCLVLGLISGVTFLRSDLPASRGLAVELQQKVDQQWILISRLPTKRLLFGVGPRAIDHYLSNWHQGDRLPRIRAREKSQLTSLWLEFGIVGVLAFLTLLARWWSLVKERHQADPLQRALTQGILAALFFFCFTDLFSSFALMVLFWSLFGASVGRAIKDGRGPKAVYRLIHEQHPL